MKQQNMQKKTQNPKGLLGKKGKGEPERLSGGEAQAGGGGPSGENGRQQKENIQGYLGELQKLGIVLGLESMRNLMEELGNVQDRLPAIHVAGTNGKGSVCAMLSSILCEAGYKVGTYTSPAVFSRREQYQVNGEAISQENLEEILAEVKEACERLLARGRAQPTAFEVETAAAFLYFCRRECQVILLEAGMGGEGDATNIIRKPLASILTSISMDHMKFLGDSLGEIARAKAGIIKEGGVAIVAEPAQEEVQQAIERACQEKHAGLVYAKEGEAKGVSLKSGRLCFSYGALGEIALSMTGFYQIQNSICAIKAAEALQDMGWEIPASAVKKGLEKSQWEGRFSILCQEPLFIIDGAHNQDAAEKLQKTLKMGFTNRKIIYIIGVLADKEYGKMLDKMLPLAWKVFTITPGNPRALHGRELAEVAKKYHRDITFFPEISEAVRQSLEVAAKEQAIVLAFGSLSYLGEIKKALKDNI